MSEELVNEVGVLKTGDDALEEAMTAKRGKANPNSAAAWTYAVDKDVKNPQAADRMNRSVSTVAVAGGLVLAADLSGYLHCFDSKSGKEFWKHDMGAAVYGSPLVVDGKIFLADEAGHVRVFKLAEEKKILAEMVMKQKIENGFAECPVYTTPVFANGVLYVAGKERLFAIGK